MDANVASMSLSNLSHSQLWELADLFEDRSRDKHKFGPLQRMVWAEAARSLSMRLGDRNV